MEFTITESRAPRARSSKWIMIREDGTFNPFVDVSATLAEAIEWAESKLMGIVQGQNGCPIEDAPEELTAMIPVAFAEVLA